MTRLLGRAVSSSNSQITHSAKYIHSLLQNYVSTIGVDFKIRTIDVNGRAIKLQIWDTAGQERFQSITANYYNGSHAIAIVYDVTNRESFDNLRKWVADVDRLGNPQVCRIIVGNKVDLEDKRQVKYEEGQAFADNLGVPFIETSAKTTYNVQQLFTQMCVAISNRQGRGDQTGMANPGRRLTPGRQIQRNCPC